jgi:aryl-alcohol dehydrogenase-like predicted oxidoreductase
MIEDIANAHDVGPTAVALAWTRQAGPDIVITGARNTTQLQENLNCDVELTQHEVLELGSAARELEEAGRKVCDNIFSYRW